MKTKLSSNPVFARCTIVILSVCLFSTCRSGCNSSVNKQVSEFKKATRRNMPSVDWREYNGDGARSHYSPLVQITKENVERLKNAWFYSSVRVDSILKGTQMQCNPIIVNGILYGVSADTRAFALDAANGNELWKTNIEDNGGTTSRGVTYYSYSPSMRIFFGAGKWLYSKPPSTWLNPWVSIFLNGSVGKITVV